MPASLLPQVTLPSRWRQWWVHWGRRWKGMVAGASMEPGPSLESLLGDAVSAGDVGAVHAALVQGADPARASPFRPAHAFSTQPFSWTEYCAASGNFSAALLCHAHEVALHPHEHTRLARAVGNCLIGKVERQLEDPGQARDLHRLVLAVLPHADDDLRAEIYERTAKNGSAAGVALFTAILSQAGSPQKAAGEAGNPHPFRTLINANNAGGLRAILPYLSAEELAKDWDLEASTLVLSASRMPMIIRDALALPNWRGQLNDGDTFGSGWTLLMQCVQRLDFETASLLLDAGASGGITDFTGRTALHHLAAQMPHDMQEQLLPLWRKMVNAGASPDAPDQHGFTPAIQLERRVLEDMAVLEARVMNAVLSDQIPSAPAGASPRRSRM